MIFNLLNSLCETLKVKFSLKPMVIDDIRVRLARIINTLIAIAQLDPEDTLINGYEVSEYKLDPCLKELVYPRAVRLVPLRFVENYKQVPDYLYYKDESGNDVIYEAMTPAEFSLAQEELFGACRSNCNLTVDVAEASGTVMLSDAFYKAIYDGCCHYQFGDAPYLPKYISYNDNSNKAFIFNFSTDAMCTMLVDEIVKGIANGRR